MKEGKALSAGFTVRRDGREDGLGTGSQILMTVSQMCVCVFACMRASVWLCLLACVCVFAPLRARAWRMCLCKCVCSLACLRLCVSVSACLCVSVCVCVCLWHALWLTPSLTSALYCVGETQTFEPGVVHYSEWTRGLQPGNGVRILAGAGTSAQWVPATISPRVICQGRGSVNSLLCSIEVEQVELYF